jgi:naphthoate synthase
VSETFDPTRWREVEGWDGTDITYHRGVDRTGDVERDLPVVRIAFDRPEIRNAFRPRTVDELYRALDHARLTTDVGTVILTGNGPSAKDGGWAFCSGGDQRVRGATATGTRPTTPTRTRVSPSVASRSTPSGRAGCTSSRCSG